MHNAVIGNHSSYVVGEEVELAVQPIINKILSPRKLSKYRWVKRGEQRGAFGVHEAVRWWHNLHRLV